MTLFFPGVWEPPNPEAKLSYDRDFLLRLQFDQVSLQKPDNLPRLPDIILDKVSALPHHHPHPPHHLHFLRLLKIDKLWLL